MSVRDFCIFFHISIPLLRLGNNFRNDHASLTLLTRQETKCVSCLSGYILPNVGQDKKYFYYPIRTSTCIIIFDIFTMFQQTNIEELRH